MIPTVTVIPTRYEPARVRALVDVIRGDCEEIILLDNGHESPLPGSIDARGMGLYAMWNRGWEIARSRSAKVNVAILNDDIRVLPGTLRVLAAALRSQPKIGAVYPDARFSLGQGLPRHLEFMTQWHPTGSREMTGYCFMFKGELPLPPFDEGYRWWYGDTQFDESVRLAGYGVARVDHLPIEHTSDAEHDDWARRPELKRAVRRDGRRWAKLHQEDPRRQVVADRDMRTVILVPRRAQPERDQLWTWCQDRWAKYFPDLPIYEGYHNEGPFNRSAAINIAAELAGDWDFAIIIDADIFLRASQVRAAIERATKTGKTTWAHTRWRGLNEWWTRRVIRVKDPHDFGPEIADMDMDVLIEKTNPISWSCCIVVPRQVWDAIGGFDERFRGWGFEDHAFRATVTGLHGWKRLPGDVYHLWHDRPLGTGRAAKASGEYTAEAITNARLGRRYMVAVLRDHGIGDQVGHEYLSPEDAAVHIGNLQRDDAKLVDPSGRLALPDWSKWWPTLEELNAGAKEYRRQAQRGVTVVVHTGGAPEMWEERIGYLRRSLSSLSENVTGPIIQRVIYSDWGADRLEALRAIGDELGFYVAGPNEHVGYTDSMQKMWGYLGKRAKGEYVFMAEDDFTYDRPVDLEPMIDALRLHPHLLQMALLRDAYYQDERETGGILGWPEPAFERRPGWLEHKLFWTANPSLFRKSLTATPWPSGKSSEVTFGRRLFADSTARAAFWGEGDAWISHIGEVRAGTGY